MSKFLKAIVAGVGALGTSLMTAAATDGIVWGSEGWVILGGTLVTFAGTYIAPNSSYPPPSPPVE
jgi:hypothetical protein